MKAPVPRRPMTPGEKLLALALSRCRFSVGSFDKRFARDMGALARTGEPHPGITEKQAALLRSKVTTYRRQIAAADIDEADRALLQKLFPGTGNRTAGGSAP